MVRFKANDWLQRAGDESAKAHALVLDALFKLAPQDLSSILRFIKDYEGTKVLISCTDRTDLADVLKLSLCCADLTVIVPAPLWISCDGPQTRYAEFNYDSVGTGRWNSTAAVNQKISELLTRFPLLFDEGIVTFLPELGESLHRWSHADLELPVLPSPYSEAPRNYTTLDVQMEGLYGLCGERLVGQRIGAMHLNSTSFASPVLSDFAIARNSQTGDWVRSLQEISIPDVSTLPLSEVLQLRRELSPVFSQFSRALRDALPAGARSSGTAAGALEVLSTSAANLARQLTDLLRTGAHPKAYPLRQITYVLANCGTTAQAIDFLTGGGGLRDFVDLITGTGSGRPKIRDDSFFAFA